MILMESGSDFLKKLKNARAGMKNKNWAIEDVFGLYFNPKKLPMVDERAAYTYTDSDGWFRQNDKRAVAKGYGLCLQSIKFTKLPTITQGAEQNGVIVTAQIEYIPNDEEDTLEKGSISIWINPALLDQYSLELNDGLQKGKYSQYSDMLKEALKNLLLDFKAFVNQNKDKWIP